MSDLTDADTQKALAAVLTGALPEFGRALDIVGLDLQRGNGFSSETWYCTVRSATGGERRLVLRLAPEGEGVFPSYNLGQQYRILHTLKKENFPVPAAWNYSAAEQSAFSRDLLIMEHVAGRAAKDAPVYTSAGWLLEIKPSAQRAAYLATLKLLADLHTVEWQRHGLGKLRRLDGRARQGGSEFSYYRDYAEWVAPATQTGILSRTESWLLDNMPSQGRQVLNWGDAKLSNVLFDDAFQPVSLLDWEMAYVGPPEADVGFWLIYDRWASEGLGFPRVPGFPDREETLGLYEAFAGRRLQNVEYFEVWAAYRLALIQFRLDYLLRQTSKKRLGGRPIFLPAVEILDSLVG